MNSSARADFYAWARLAQLAIGKGDPDVAELGRDIRVWLQDGCRADLVAAQDASPGGVDIEARTAALVAYTALHCRTRKSARAKASLLHELIGKYEASAAYREREQFAEINPHKIGTERGDAWEFLRRHRLPSASRIRKIVGHGP